jgi:hypothetical protein
MKAYKKSFQKILAQHFEHQAGDCQIKIEAAFELLQADVQFAKHSPNPVDKRMEMAAYFLATIQVLDAQSMDYETIKKIIIEIAQEYVRPKNQWQVFLKQLPPKLIGSRMGDWMIKEFQKRVREKGHPDGFQVNILTDKAETLGLGYGFDIIECGICKLFQKHQYQRFASILCEVDYITSSLAGLTLIRTSTIAYGAKKCDFRFQIKQHNA